MNTSRLRVQLFGAFRKYAPDGDVHLEVPPGTPLAAVRTRLGEALREIFPAFRDQGLLDVSVFADDERILDDGQALGDDRAELSLAVLPPVCGG